MKILLLHLPFGPIQWPSIGLSLLSAAMHEIDVACEVRYFAMDYGKQIGVSLYQRFAEIRLLGLMDKGVSAIQNIRLLKWSRELGIQPIGNILWGFDGEDIQHYLDLSNIIALLTHLTPPVYRTDAQSGLDISKVAYLFKEANRSPVDQLCQHKIIDSVQQWHKHHDTSDLLLISNESGAAIIDTRSIASVDRYELNPIEFFVLRWSDDGATVQTLEKYIYDGADFSSEQLASSISQLEKLGYLLKLGEKYISLPTPAVNIKAGAKRKLKQASA